MQKRLTGLRSGRREDDALDRMLDGISDDDDDSDGVNGYAMGVRDSEGEVVL
jgi:hypothetical protein